MTRADWEKSYARAEAALREAGVETSADLLKLEEVRVRFMGRKGELTELLKSLKDLSIEDKRELGPKAQGLKATFDAAIAARAAALQDQGDEAALAADAIDLTLPGIRAPRGRLHPLTTTLHEIARIFQLM